jgi:hypothetical protein
MKTQFLVILVAMQMLVGISMANDTSNTFSEIESIKLEIDKNYTEGMIALFDFKIESKKKIKEIEEKYKKNPEEREFQLSICYLEIEKTELALKNKYKTIESILVGKKRALEDILEAQMDRDELLLAAKKLGKIQGQREMLSSMLLKNLIDKDLATQMFAVYDERESLLYEKYPILKSIK